MKPFLLALLVPFLLNAQTSLWKISDGTNHLYLGGTIHLLRPNDYPLPHEFDSAFTRSSVVVFETDLAAMNDPLFQATLIRALTLPEGSTIRDLLSTNTIQILERHLDKIGVPLATIERFKPSMVAILLTQWELHNLSMAEEGVDVHYHRRALAAGVGTAGLESTEEQIGFLADLGSDDPDGLILNTLKEMEEVPMMIETMISAWKSGDTDALDSVIVRDMKERYPSVFQSLLIDRNLAWLPMIRNLVASDPVELILVGAGHLVGDDGLLELLNKNGFSVEPARFTTQ